MEEITHYGKLSLDNTTVEFRAEYEDYYITGEAECDIVLEREEEPELGIQNSYYLDDISYWYLNLCICLWHHYKRHYLVILLPLI